MTYEAVLVQKMDDAIDFIVADGTGIEKGTLCKLTSPKTAIKSSGAQDVIAGIAAREKVASDGRTRLACYRRGVFRMYASGAITAGQPVYSAGVDNMVKYIAAAIVSGAAFVGTALQDISDAAAGEIHVNVGAR